MRICLLADMSGHRDEGMKNIGDNIARELAKKHEVLYTAVSSIFDRSKYRLGQGFNEDFADNSIH